MKITKTPLFFHLYSNRLWGGGLGATASIFSGCTYERVIVDIFYLVSTISEHEMLGVRVDVLVKICSAFSYG